MSASGRSAPVVEACIALGSNLGDRALNLSEAIDRLRRVEGLTEVRVSGYYETAAVGMADRSAPAFLNAAVRCRTTLSAMDLLSRLLRIEHDLGRRRLPARREAGSESRTLDLDLLLYGDAVIDTPGLVVPHPRMHLRRFVLEPLAEVAGELTHPVLGRTVAELLAEV